MTVQSATEQSTEIDTRSVNQTFQSENPDHRMTMMEVSVNDLAHMIIDPNIQRTQQDTEVDYIVKNFNPTAIGVFTASLREDGTRAVVDGQQRRAALLRLHAMGAFDGKVQLMLHEHLSIAEEARLFLDLNARRAVDAIRRFKTRLVAEDPQAIAINKMLKHLGLTISSRGVQAIETVDRIYEQPNGPERLNWSLSMIRDVYDVSRHGGCYDGRVIVAFSLMHAAFIDILDEERFIDALAKTSNRISTLHGAGKTKHTLEKGNLAYNMAEVLRGWYNDTKRRTTRLPAKLPDFPKRTLEALLEQGKEAAAEAA